MMLVPAAEVHWHDTWHTSGLCGTGSTDFEIDGSLVPRQRSVNLVSNERTIDTPLFRIPAFGLLASGIAAVALGNAAAALREALSVATSKHREGAMTPMSERPVTHAIIGENRARLEAARAYLHTSLNRIFDAAAAGRPGLEQRSSVRLASNVACDTAAEVTTAMYRLAGGTSVYRTSPLQRMFRDAHVMTQHIMVAPNTYEQVGRLTLGLETNTAML